MSMIVARNLTKEFPQPDGGVKRAVAEVCFSIKAGEIYGLLGPNGAGKTTTLRMLSGMMAPTSGDALLNGHNILDDAQAIKKQIGFLTANTGLYPRLTSVLLRILHNVHNFVFGEFSTNLSAFFPDKCRFWRLRNSAVFVPVDTHLVARDMIKLC